VKYLQRKHFPVGTLFYFILTGFCLLYVPAPVTQMSMVFLGLLGQSVFVLLYATRDWRSQRFTRAMMLKSATLFLLFLLGTIRLSVTGRPAIQTTDPLWLQNVTIAANILIIIAVWYQAIALFIEIRIGYTMEMAKTQYLFDATEAERMKMRGENRDAREARRDAREEVRDGPVQPDA
jgi:hypothetical protein